MDHRKLGKVLFLVGILTGAVVAGGVMYYFSVSGLKELLKNREVEIEKLLEQLRGKEELLKKREEEISKLSEQIKYKQEEISKLEELLKKYELPTIMNISWKPTEIVNNKVYDGRVSFVAESKYSPIAEAYLIFTPRIYAHLPKEAFPEESPRGYILTPIDGVFDGNKEEFSVDIMNIKGGREYDITAITVNSLGMMNKGELPTPYIREFENIAPLDDVLVGAFYYPWYNKYDPWFHFWFNEREWKSLGYEASPLLGQYHSDDPILISKHIDWATGHGIDYFLISWGYVGGPGGFNDRVFKKSILKSPLVDQMKFCILYESGGRLTKTEEGEFDLTNSQNRQQLCKDFSYFIDDYFSHSSYLEIGDKKVVFFDASRAFVGDVQGILKEIRESTIQRSLQLYLMCDALGNYLPPTNPRMIELLKSFDAVTADDMWCNNYGDSDARRDFISYTKKTLELWKSHAEMYGKDMIPSINPGWEPYLYFKLYPNFDAPFLKRNTNRYDQLFSIGLKYGNHIIVGHFNEFMTHNHIESDTKDGFAYLNVTKKYLTGS